jgi:hypothetical protein
MQAAAAADPSGDGGGVAEAERAVRVSERAFKKVRATLLTAIIPHSHSGRADRREV